VKIKTAYDVGHEFWAPRVYTEHSKDTIIMDGKEYYRDEKLLHVLAKNKVVTAISVYVTKESIYVRYQCRDVIDVDGYSIQYSEQELGFTTKEAALEFARMWRDTEQTEYFGDHQVNQ